MRTVITFVIAASSIGGVQRSAAAQCVDHNPAVTVRVHDYVHVNGDSLQQAQEIVTRLYKNVGVGIEWLETFQMDVNRTRSEPRIAHATIAQLTINILTPSMAARASFARRASSFVCRKMPGWSSRARL